MITQTDKFRANILAALLEDLRAELQEEISYYQLSFYKEPL